MSEAGENNAERRDSFLLEEYKSLKVEIESRVHESALVQNAVLLATAGIYAWLATNTATSVTPLGWWMPVGLSAVAGLRNLAVLWRVLEIASYIRSIETHFGATASGHGWETILAKTRAYRWQSNVISLTGFAFWCVMVVMTTVIAIVYS